MKIALIGPVHPYRGGIAHYTSHLAINLISAGYETKVISFQRQYPACLYPGPSDKDSSVEPLSVSAEYILDPLYPWTWMQTIKAILEFAPDIITIQWWTTFWAPAFAVLSWIVKKKGMQVVYIIHNVLPHEEKFWDRKLARYALLSGKGYIVQTEREKERLRKLMPETNTIVCPHPIYNSLAQTKISKTKARVLLGLPENTPILLSFGIVRPYKGLSVLLDALALLKKRNIALYLLIAGEFWEDKSNYIRQIEQLGLKDHVRIEDRYIPDEEVAQIFSAVDVLVAPYIGGTQSGVASWGLGFGLPLIVSDKVAAGITEKNLHRVAVVPAGDHIHLASTIEEVIQKDPNQKNTQQIPAYDKNGWDDLIQGLMTFVKKA